MNISDINKYKKFVENGVYSNGQIERLADRYSQQEQQSISHLDVIINSTRANTIYKNGTAYKCIVDYGSLPKKSTSTQTMSYREVWTRRSDQFTTGDIVQFAPNQYDHSVRKTYLFLTTLETRDGYDLSVMNICYSSIKWLDSSGKIREEWFTIRKESLSETGINEDKVLNLPSERRYIVTQSNIYTQTIKKDQRFIFDNRIWKTISVDGLVSGLITLTLEENLESNANDNMELRIADYYNNVHTYMISILNGSNVTINPNDTIQLNVEVKDNGVVSSLPVTYTSSDATIATVSSTGLVTTLLDGSVIITATITSHPTTATSILLSISTVAVDNFSMSISGADECKVTQSQSYSSIISNNGIADNTKTVAWSLLNDDGVSSTDLAEITSQTGTNCTIKGLKYLTPSTNSYVKLVAAMVGNPSVTQVKRIKIRSLF